MAKPQKLKNKDGSTSYRIFVNNTVDGVVVRESKSFLTRPMAIKWVEIRKKEIERAKAHSEISIHLIKNVFMRYQEATGKITEVLMTHGSNSCSIF